MGTATQLRDVPPSSLFRLVADHVASRSLLALARASDAVLTEMGRLAAALPRAPVSVIVFGSFARGGAEAGSDVDVVIVRPSSVDEDDDTWVDSLDDWRHAVRRVSGNPVEVLEVSLDEAARKLGSRGQVWSDVRRDGIVVHGLGFDELRETRVG